jgi:F0F1-type ATP synthase assembly protein I
MKSPDDLRGQLIRSMTFAMTVGLELACVLLICVVVGHYLDTRFHTSPWGLLVGILVGVAGGGWTAYRMATRVLR